MSIKKIHLALVVLTSLIFALANLYLRQYWIAVFALVIGACWLLVEKYSIELIFNLFFVGFIWLAARGSINDLPIPLMLFGLCTNLAAWDLSRFQARIREFKVQNPHPRLVTKHLQKLLITICLGYVLALIPTFISLSMNFVVVVVLSLLILFALRQSVITLRNDKSDDIKNNDKESGKNGNQESTPPKTLYKRLESRR